MATREVLSSANRGSGGFDTLTAQPSAEAVNIRYVVRMTQAQLENTANRFDFSVYGSTDNFVTVQFLGGCSGWQGGTYVNKQGQTVTMEPPDITIEATPSIKEMQIRAHVECGRGVRFSMDLED